MNTYAKVFRGVVDPVYSGSDVSGADYILIDCRLTLCNQWEH